MKIRIASLGCRLNRAEIESISTALQEQGHTVTRSDDADVFIVNSCAVTGKSEKATLRLITRFGELAAARGGRVIVAGCTAERLGLEGNVFHVPNDYKAIIPEIIRDWEGFTAPIVTGGARFDYVLPTGSSTTRANLKIQDGCDNFCTYCVVPLKRGAPRSKPAGRVLDECARLVESGFREIVLTGVMIGAYAGEGTGDGRELADLTASLLDLPGRFRLHLSSIMPVYVTPKLVDLLRHDNMVKHLHLSLQSGSDAVLARMKRPYGRKEYLSIAGRIREAAPDINLTTDVIVGFPGETDEDFLRTLEILREAGISHAHTFRYSPRPGTAAAAMTDQVPEGTRRERSERMIEASEALRRDYRALFEGRRSVFLSERARRGVTSGFNEYYVPIEAEGSLPRGEFFTVTTRVKPGGDALAGTVVAEA